MGKLRHFLREHLHDIIVIAVLTLAVFLIARFIRSPLVY